MSGAHVPARRRLAARLAWLLPLAALLALGALWRHDRQRTWDLPRWNANDFVLIEERERRSGAETWMVAIHPACPHCQVSLREALSRRERDRSPIAVEALVVDQPERPAAATVAGLPCDRVWWDARGLWRRRWGHRVYGEVMCFGAGGALRRCLSPLIEAAAAPESAPARGGDTP